MCESESSQRRKNNHENVAPFFMIARTCITRGPVRAKVVAHNFPGARARVLAGESVARAGMSRPASELKRTRTGSAGDGASASRKRARGEDGAGAPACNLPRADDEDGHLVYKLGDGLHPTGEFANGRYKILSDLGEGTFGKVVECWDRRGCRRVAIKVVRSVSKYREAARLEIDVLLHLSLHDPDALYHCVKLYSWFDYCSHVCMVFEKLGPSLYEHLRRNRFRPFTLNQVREYAFQLLESVHFVHNLTLIHTDLKPENILLVDTKRCSSIKLIDFGSATFESQHHSDVISTRHYRAPEVILGLGWTYPCDLWSIGCILVELYTGQALFQTHENLEHLAMMSCVLGPMPESMIRRADRYGQKYFARRPGGRRALNWPGGASSKASIRSVRHVQPLPDIISHENFLDLVRRLLAFEPDMRCTAAEALRHPFFREAPLESDPQASTPTMSSGSSACGSLGLQALRGQYCHALRQQQPAEPTRPPDSKRPPESRRPPDSKRPPNPKRPREPQNAPGLQKLDDDGEDTATELPTATELSDHTLGAVPPSPRTPRFAAPASMQLRSYAAATAHATRVRLQHNASKFVAPPQTGETKR